MTFLKRFTNVYHKEIFSYQQIYKVIGWWWRTSCHLTLKKVPYYQYIEFFWPTFMTFLIDSIASNRFLIPILAKYSSSFSFYSNIFLTITKRECLWWKRCKFSFLLFWLLSISSRLSKVRKPPLLSASVCYIFNNLFFGLGVEFRFFLCWAASFSFFVRILRLLSLLFVICKQCRVSFVKISNFLHKIWAISVSHQRKKEKISSIRIHLELQ